MNIYFDENFPPSIPKALDCLEEFDKKNSILSTSIEIGLGVKDPKLIKHISKNNGVWVTFDRKSLKAHIKVLKRYKVPVFAFEYGSSHGYWEKTYLTLKHWKRIKELIQDNKSKKSYAFRILKTTIKPKE